MIKEFDQRNTKFCFNNPTHGGFCCCFLVGLPARPKSPSDPRKDGESLSYSMLPLSDGPEGSSSRPQVSSIECLRRKI